MALANAREIYRRYIKRLPLAERLRLLAIVAQDLASEAPSAQPGRSIMELHGLGKEIWNGVDAQQYVDQLRSEWHRPAFRTRD